VKTIPPTLETLTLWPEASLASLSVFPASAEARRMTATSGRTLIPLLKDTDPLGCLSRMLLGSSVWRSTSSVLTWKARVTPRKRLYFRLVPSVPHMNGSASSSWRTPQAAGHKSAHRPYATRAQINLTHQIFWPTPTATNAAYSGNGYGPTLRQSVTLWPTPTAIDSGSGRVNRSTSANAAARPTLALMARKGTWPTPTYRDYKSGTGALARPGHPPPLTDVVQGNLNPDWVECLMGLPPGWTKCGGLPHQENGSTHGSHQEP